MGVALARVVGQALEAIDRVDELGRPLGDAGQIAKPEAGQLEALVQRLGLGAARGALDALLPLARVTTAVALGEELRLGLERAAQLGHRLLAVAPGARQEALPGRLVERSSECRARERL